MSFCMYLIPPSFQLVVLTFGRIVSNMLHGSTPNRVFGLISCHYLHHTLETCVFQYQSSDPLVVTPFGLLPGSRMFIAFIGLSLLLQSRSFTMLGPPARNVFS